MIRGGGRFFISAAIHRLRGRFRPMIERGLKICCHRTRRWRGHLRSIRLLQSPLTLWLIWDSVNSRIRSYRFFLRRAAGCWLIASQKVSRWMRCWESFETVGWEPIGASFPIKRRCNSSPQGMNCDEIDSYTGATERWGFRNYI